MNKRGRGRPKGSSNKKRGRKPIHKTCSILADRLQSVKDKKEKIIYLLQLQYINKRLRNAVAATNAKSVRTMEFKLIALRAAKKKEFNQMVEKFKTMVISKPSVVSPKRFFGEKASVHKIYRENNEIMARITDKYQHLGTVTSSLKLVNLIFAENSIQGKLFIPRQTYPLLYNSFYELNELKILG